MSQRKSSFSWWEKCWLCISSSVRNVWSWSSANWSLVRDALYGPCAVFLLRWTIYCKFSPFNIRIIHLFIRFLYSLIHLFKVKVWPVRNHLNKNRLSRRHLSLFTCRRSYYPILIHKRLSLFAFHCIKIKKIYSFYKQWCKYRWNYWFCWIVCSIWDIAAAQRAYYLCSVQPFRQGTFVLWPRNSLSPRSVILDHLNMLLNWYFLNVVKMPYVV